MVYGFDINGAGNILYPGHFFNVLNDGGNVKFLDGQTGGYAVLGVLRLHLYRRGGMECSSRKR
ncbi:hypothetical protein [Streptomyces sp. NPDC093223]|uniref:hypothetical protein n=1 Tax=Streptomyces sp. NPDC093223 TaxID=3366033 RepID=UPI0037F420F6